MKQSAIFISLLIFTLLLSAPVLSATAKAVFYDFWGEAQKGLKETLAGDDRCVERCAVGKTYTPEDMEKDGMGVFHKIYKV